MSAATLKSKCETCGREVFDSDMSLELDRQRVALEAMAAELEAMRLRIAMLEALLRDRTREG